MDASLYRYYGFERYSAHLTNPSSDRIAAYRAQNLRCRRERTTLFVRDDDLAAARQIDHAAEGTS